MAEKKKKTPPKKKTTTKKKETKVTKPKETKTASQTPTILELALAAVELCKVCKLEPIIKTKDMKGDELRKEIKEMMEEYQGEKLTPGTKTVLTVLGHLKPGTKKEAKPKAKATKKAAPKKEIKAAVKKNGKVVKAKKVAAPKKPKAPGVIFTIHDIILRKGPITRDKIHQELVKKFPDRTSEALFQTLRSETVKTALMRHPLQKDDQGRFSVRK